MLEGILRKYASGGLQWAQLADKWAAKMETAQTRVDFNTAFAKHTQARIKLLSVLNGLAAKAAPTETGMGLLPVETLLRERDPSLLGVYTKIATAESSLLGRAAFFCATEAHLFVFPERPPLKALLFGWQYLYRMTLGGDVESQVAGAELLEPILEELRRDDFWIPQGTSSLDGFFASMSATVESAKELEARMLLAQEKYAWSWEKVRDDLKDSDPAQLRRMIGFRRDLTAVLMDKAVDTVAPGARTRYGPARFRWIVYEAPGSDRITSDHDVSARGSSAAAVVATFNTLFRQWTLGAVDEDGNPRSGYAGPKAPCELESAYVFDVNVYTNEYHWNQGRRFLVPDAPDADFWPTDKKLRKQAGDLQDRYALLKMRRYMPDSQWSAFTAALSQAVTGDDRTAAETQLKAVTDAWPGLEDTVKARIAKVGDDPQFKAYTDKAYVDTYGKNIKVRAENELYQERLNDVETLRFNGGTELTDDVRVKLAGALGLAGFYAQEAYHTAGAVRDIVANVQLRRGLVLSDVDLLCSMNEQAGDIFKEIGHLDEGIDPTTDVKFAVKVSKYMVRLGNAAISLNFRLLGDVLMPDWRLERAAKGFSAPAKDVTPQISVPQPFIANLSQDELDMLATLLDLRSLCESWRRSTVRLLEIKDHPEDFESDAGKAEIKRRLTETPWIQGGKDIQSFLLNLTVAINAHYRGKSSGSAIRAFLKTTLAAVMDLVKRRAAETKPSAKHIAEPSH
jgi:hypothetical protein